MSNFLRNNFPQIKIDQNRESIGGTWHMPIGTILNFSLFTNNVRTAGPIGIHESLNLRSKMSYTDAV